MRRRPPRRPNPSGSPSPALRQPFLVSFFLFFSVARFFCLLSLLPLPPRLAPPAPPGSASVRPRVRSAVMTVITWPSRSSRRPLLLACAVTVPVPIGSAACPTACSWATPHRTPLHARAVSLFLLSSTSQSTRGMYFIAIYLNFEFAFNSVFLFFATDFFDRERQQLIMSHGHARCACSGRCACACRARALI